MATEARPLSPSLEALSTLSATRCLQKVFRRASERSTSVKSSIPQRHKTTMSLDVAAPQTPVLSQGNLSAASKGTTPTPPPVRSPYAQSKRKIRKQRLAAAAAAAAASSVPPRTSSLDKSDRQRVLQIDEQDDDARSHSPCPPPSSASRKHGTIGSKLSRSLSNVFTTTSLSSRPGISHRSRTATAGMQSQESLSSASVEWGTSSLLNTPTSLSATFGISAPPLKLDFSQNNLHRRDSTESFKCRGLGVTNIDDLVEPKEILIEDDDFHFDRQAIMPSPLSVSRQPLAPRLAITSLYSERHSICHVDDDDDVIDCDATPPQRPPRPNTMVIANSLARMEMDNYRGSPYMASPSLDTCYTDSDWPLEYEQDDSATDDSVMMWSAPSSPLSSLLAPTTYFNTADPDCLRLSLDFAMESIDPAAASSTSNDRRRHLLNSLDDLPRELFVEGTDTVGELKDSLALALEKSTDVSISRKDLIVSVRTDEVMSPVSPGLRMEFGSSNVGPSTKRRASSNSPTVLSASIPQSMARSTSVPATCLPPLQQRQFTTFLSTPQTHSIQHRRRASASPRVPQQQHTALGLSFNAGAAAKTPPLLTVSTGRQASNTNGGPCSSPFTQRWRELNDDTPTILQDGLQDGDVIVVAIRRCIYTLF